MNANERNAKLLRDMARDYDEKKERSMVQRAVRFLDRTIRDIVFEERGYTTPGAYSGGGRNEW